MNPEPIGSGWLATWLATQRVSFLGGSRGELAWKFLGKSCELESRRLDFIGESKLVILLGIALAKRTHSSIG
jgi:hypothetical protein